MSELAIASQDSVVSTHGLLSGVYPFSELPEAAVVAVAEIGEVRDYAPGETIYAAGQYDGDELMVVVDGEVKAALVDIASGSMFVENLEAGAIFGIAATVADVEDPQAERMTLTAECDTQIIAIQSAAFRSVVAQRPSLTRVLMHYFAERLAGASLSVVDQEGAPETRVYAALLEYVERDAVTAQWRIAKMPKHRELSDKADADEAIVASAVAELIQTNVAQRDYPGLIIIDLDQLKRLAV